MLDEQGYLKRLGCPSIGDIKAITGTWSFSKSGLIDRHISCILRDNPAANIIRVDLRRAENAHLLECLALHEYAISNYVRGRENVLIINEVQLCDDYEWMLTSLQAHMMFDIYVTCSTNSLLAGDYATLPRIGKSLVFRPVSSLPPATSTTCRLRLRRLVSIDTRQRPSAESFHFIVLSRITSAPNKAKDLVRS